MNLDSIILHISFPSRFCVIGKFDKPASYVFIRVADKNLGQRRSDSEFWGVALDTIPSAVPQMQSHHQDSLDILLTEAQTTVVARR